MTILIPLIAVLIPILTLPFWLFYFDITPKILTLLGGAAVAVALLPSRMPAIRALLHSAEGRLLSVLMGCQALAILAATWLSANPRLSVAGSNWRMFGMLTQLALLLLLWVWAAAVAEDRSRLVWLWRAMALGGSAISLYAILQYLGIDPLLPAARYHIGEGEWTIVRPPGTIGHADYLGSYLVFVVFLGGSRIWTETQRRWRVVGWSSLIGGSLAILLSGTRSAILGLAFGLVLLAVRKRPGWRTVTATAAVALFLVTSFYTSPWGARLRGRARWAREDAVGGARLLLWRDTLRMAAARPFTGWGPESFSTEFPHYQSTDLARAFPDFYHESPHNIFLDELVSNGVPGAVPFFLLCLFACRAAWRTLSQEKDICLGIAFFAGLVSLQFNAFVLTTAFFYFLVCVLLLAPLPRPAPPPQPRLTGFPRWTSILAAFALALVFAAFGLRLLVADVLLAQVRAHLQAGNALGAATAYERVRQWDPRTGSSDLYYSRNMAALVRRQDHILLSVKAWQEAVQAGIRATRFAEDRQNAWYHLATLYAQINNAKEAETCLRRAIVAAPNWFKPHWMLARILLAGGRNPEARKEAELAAWLDNGKHAEVTETLRGQPAR